MRTKFKIGDRVKMTNDALDNYGEEHRDTVFIVEHTATNTNEHPGYDDGVYPMGLYDHGGFDSSLYDWELEEA